MPLSENEATMDIPTPRSYIEFVRIVAATESGLASVAIQFIILDSDKGNSADKLNRKDLHTSSRDFMVPTTALLKLLPKDQRTIEALNTLIGTRANISFRDELITGIYRY